MSGAAGGERSYVDEDDGEVSVAESAGELGRAVDDFGGRASGGGDRDDSFLEIDDDQSGGGIELSEGHGFPFA